MCIRASFLAVEYSASKLHKLVSLAGYRVKDAITTTQGMHNVMKLHNDMTHKAGGIGLAAPVLAGPVFSEGKSKIPFLQKVSNKKVLV